MPKQCIRFLLQSGKSNEILFDTNNDISTLRNDIFTTMTIDNVNSPSEIRLLYRGRFLEDSDQCKQIFTKQIEETQPPTIHVLGSKPLKEENEKIKKGCCIFQ